MGTCLERSYYSKCLKNKQKNTWSNSVHLNVCKVWGHKLFNTFSSTLETAPLLARDYQPCILTDFLSMLVYICYESNSYTRKQRNIQIGITFDGSSHPCIWKQSSIKNKWIFPKQRDHWAHARVLLRCHYDTAGNGFRLAPTPNKRKNCLNDNDVWTKLFSWQDKVPTKMPRMQWWTNSE